MRLRAPTEIVVLPRPNAGWRKVQCILRFVVRLNRARRRARGEALPDRTIPALTNAMRAIIVTRCMGMRYEGEVNPYDTLEDFLLETVQPRGGDDMGDDDDDESLEGDASGRSAGGRRGAESAAVRSVRRELCRRSCSGASEEGAPMPRRRSGVPGEVPGRARPCAA